MGEAARMSFEDKRKLISNPLIRRYFATMIGELLLSAVEDVMFPLSKAEYREKRVYPPSWFWGDNSE